MALDDFVKSDIEGQITLENGSGDILIADFDNGDIAISSIKPVLNETEKYERRGRLKSVGVGARIYPSLTFSAMIAQFSDAVADVITDFIFFQGKFLGKQSTLGPSHPEKAIKVTYDIDGVSFGGENSQVVCNDCVPRGDFAEARPSAMSFSMEVLGAITGDINAAEIS